MRKNTKYIFMASAGVLVPNFTFAAIKNFRDLMQTFIVIFGNAMSLMFAAGFAGFFWGVMLFILNANDEKKRSEGKQWMSWSVVALFVMFTVWGLVGVFTDTFQISTTVIPQLPV